jgi:ABC-2 type transport system ATP-binding protein
VREFIEELKTQGRTIFLCTHNLDEADRLCDRIGIFKSRLIAIDRPENLRKKLFGRRVVFHLAEVDPDWAEQLRTFSFIQEVQAVDNRLVVGLSDPESQNPLLVRKLVELGADVQFVGELRHSLEEIYFQTIEAQEGQAIP